MIWRINLSPMFIKCLKNIGSLYHTSMNML